MSIFHGNGNGKCGNSDTGKGKKHLIEEAIG
jgi:hypothetical protein